MRPLGGMVRMIMATLTRWMIMIVDVIMLSMTVGSVSVVVVEIGMLVAVVSMTESVFVLLIEIPRTRRPAPLGQSRALTTQSLRNVSLRDGTTNHFSSLTPLLCTCECPISATLLS
jgi:hypothetical protein